MAQGEEILGSQGLWGSEVLRHQKPGPGDSLWDTKSWGLGTACGTLFSQTSQEPGVFLGLQGKNDEYTVKQKLGLRSKMPCS